MTQTMSAALDRPPPQQPVCSKCGSDNVRADAYADFDVETQSWNLIEAYDKNAYCCDCDSYMTLTWVAV